MFFVANEILYFIKNRKFHHNSCSATQNLGNRRLQNHSHFHPVESND